jgi:hypothetical protein
MIIISELLVDDDKSGPAAAALMSLNMIIETEGRNCTASEYTAWLKDAGFVEPPHRPVRRPRCQRRRHRTQALNGRRAARRPVPTAAQTSRTGKLTPAASAQVSSPALPAGAEHHRKADRPEQQPHRTD